MLNTKELAVKLDHARREAREIPPLKVDFPDLSLTEAYEIQAHGIEMRTARGEKRVGMKMGLTSEAKRKQMGLDSPVYGVLLDSTQIEDGGVFSLNGTIHPKIEPEIAFVLKKDIQGKLTFEEALEACAGVCAALEILDSRYTGFKYFSLPDVVADNSSSSHFVLGVVKTDYKNLNLGDLLIEMEVNGKVVESARSNAISGHPLNSLIALSEILCAEGKSLKAGSIVLAGAATLAVPLEEGMSIRGHVQGLQTVLVNVSGSVSGGVSGKAVRK